MTLTMLVLRGLPASGKSTFAKGLVLSDPEGWVRVNKDDIRERMLPTGWSKQKERDVVIPERDRLIAGALASGKNVIVDDTNLEQKHLQRLYEISVPFGAEMQLKDFEISVDDAIARDAKRFHPVGEDVIRKMADRFFGATPAVVPYFEESGLPWALICDLDGTVSLFCQKRSCGCHLNHRSPYNASTADRDTPNRPVLQVLEAMAMTQAPEIIFMSGREAEYRPQTVAFLEKHFRGPHQLHMRKNGDRRKDSVVKSELFDAHVRGKFNVHFVLDDRDQVVQLWRALGLTCLQVAEGSF